MKKTFALFCVIVGLLCFMVSASATAADKYPSKPIKFLVPFAAGGTDTICRKLAEVIKKLLGQEVLVENKPGAGGILAANFLVKSKPDGYTIGVLGSSVFLIAPNFSKLEFDPLADLDPICQMTIANHTLQVTTSSPIKSFKDFVNEAKKRQVTVGAMGMTATDIAMRKLAIMGKLNIKMVPFEGAGPLTMAAMGGQVDAIAIGSNQEYIKAGKLINIARMSEEVKGPLKDVPSLKELGYDVNAVIFSGVFAPKGLPPAVHKRLEEEFLKAQADPVTEQTIEMVGETPLNRNSKDFAALLKKASDQSKQDIKDLGLGIYAPVKK